MKYIVDRARELGIVKLAEDGKRIIGGPLLEGDSADDWCPISRIHEDSCKYTEMNLSSAAMGDNALSFIEMPGRVLLDVYGAMRKNHANLNSYKLDFVASTFLFGKVKGLFDVKGLDSTMKIRTDKTFGLQIGGYVHFVDDEGEYIGTKEKHHILDIGEDDDGAFIEIKYDEIVNEDFKMIIKWTQAKDDVPPSEIFRLQLGDSDDRAKVAKYCIQDCNLVLMLNTKVETIPNSIAMANVCSVPLSYIFFRGQGIKLASLVFKECSQKGQVIRVLAQHTSRGIGAELDGYEGAVVLEPKTGL